MRKLLGVIFVLLVLGSVFADYYWKRWMAARRRAREDGASSESRKD